MGSRSLPLQVAEGLNDTSENLMAAIAADEPEVSPSTLYATAAILEGVPFINGSPQNTFVPGALCVLQRVNTLHEAAQHGDRGAQHLPLHRVSVSVRALSLALTQHYCTNSTCS